MEDLFIDLFPELENKCVEWCKDLKSVRPMMFAVEIGTGKTTLLNRESAHFSPHFFQTMVVLRPW